MTRRLSRLAGLTTSPDQTLLIELQGASASRIRPGLLDDPEALAELPDPLDAAEGSSSDDSPQVDVVEVFLGAFNQGLLYAASGKPWECRGALLKSELDEPRQVKRWQLELHDVVVGAFRVLQQLLRSLDPVRQSLQTLSSADDAAEVRRVGSVPYPGRASTLPFPLEISPEASEGEINAVRLVFREKVAAPLEEAGVRGLDAWSRLLVLGGYQDDEEYTSGLAAAPEPPALVDAFTLEVAFEMFNSAPASLNAIINLAHRLHHTMAPIATIEVE